MASTAKMNGIARRWSRGALWAAIGLAVLALLSAVAIFTATPAHGGQVTVVIGSGRCYLPPPPFLPPPPCGGYAPPAFVPDCVPPWAQPYGGGYVPPPWATAGGLPFGPPDRYSSSIDCRRGRCEMDETAVWEVPGGRIRMDRTVPVAPPWARPW